MIFTTQSHGSPLNHARVLRLTYKHRQMAVAYLSCNQALDFCLFSNKAYAIILVKIDYK